MINTKLFSISLASIYPLYTQKLERKGRTQEELDQVICWLTGYSKIQLSVVLSEQVSLKDFFEQAPCIHPNASKITGTICGYKVEEITDSLLQKIRYMDKLVDELARGKSMDKVLRK